LSLLSRNTPLELPLEVRQKALEIKNRKGKFAAIRFLSLEHRVGLRDAKDFVEGHDAYGREIPPGQRKRPAGIIGKAFLIIAAIMLAIAFSIYYLQADFIKKGRSLNGVVVDMVDTGDSFSPVIRYEVSGTNYETQLDISTNPPAYEINEEVHIWVSSEDPGKILVDSITGRFIPIIVLTSLGFIFGLIGILLKMFLGDVA
jgi:hypothetical protein